jgi:uroporphyrinogen decarboxylase
MSELSHRERVIMSLKHQQPDRVPLDMMGNASMLLDKTYLRLRDHLGLQPIAPIRSGTSANYYDERILEYFDIDFRRVFLKKSPKNMDLLHEDGSFTDIWGIRYQQHGIFVNIMESPLKNVQSIEDVDAYPWPTAQDLYNADGLAEVAKKLYETTDYAVVARNPLSPGFLDRGCFLVGMAEFLMLLALKPEIAARVVTHILDIHKGVYSIFLDAVGPYVHLVEAADDLGGQQQLLISPQMYRQFIKPAQTELYSLIHEKAPQAFLVHHSDGNIFKIIPDLVQAGVNVLNPVQTSTNGMDALRLKENYGNIVAFHGAIEKMEASKDELVAEVKEKCQILGKGGGYILASCNHMIDVEPENIVAMFDTARECSRNL